MDIKRQENKYIDLKYPEISIACCFTQFMFEGRDFFQISKILVTEVMKYIYIYWDLHLYQHGYSKWRRFF